MKTQLSLIMAIAVLGLAAHTGTARAAAPNVPDNLKFEMNFCSKTLSAQVGGTICKNGMVYNSAAVVVTKVKVKQLAGPNGCTAVEKIYSRNMSQGEAPFGVRLRKDCEYRVQFNTTSGCTGDKVVKITPKDLTLATPVTVANLEGICGSLKGNKYNFRSPVF